MQTDPFFSDASRDDPAKVIALMRAGPALPGRLTLKNVLSAGVRIRDLQYTELEVVLVRGASLREQRLQLPIATVTGLGARSPAGPRAPLQLSRSDVRLAVRPVHDHVHAGD
jgi:hypothetical protein